MLHEHSAFVSRIESQLQHQSKAMTVEMRDEKNLLCETLDNLAEAAEEGFFGGYAPAASTAEQSGDGAISHLIPQINL